LRYFAASAMRTTLTLLLLFSFSTAFSQQADSTFREPLAWKKENKAKAFIAPAALIGVGIATIGDKKYFSSYDTYNLMQRNFPGFHTKVDDATWIMPVAAVYGLNLMGLKGKNNFIDRSAMLALSIVLANSISMSSKHHYSSLRPDGSEYNSFPSGHTTNAFVAAEFMHQEYKHLSPWYSVAGYSLATATGIMRMMNNRHWMSDVLVGAGLGMASVKAVYLAYPWAKKKIFKKEDASVSTMVVPYYNGSVAGVTAVWSVR
jgi:membrane-associated phospholipid phosphatase